MTGPIPKTGVLDITLYQAGASGPVGAQDVLKLSSNENPFGPPPSAQAALAPEAYNLHRYPSTDHASLRGAIGDLHGLDPDRIICGVGSDEVISFLCYAYSAPGDEVIYTEHGFSMYKISARAAGATPVCVAERARTVSVPKILEAITDRTKLIFIANPGNPTGTMVSDAQLKKLVDGVPPHIVIVLDGAYAEFAEGYDGGVSLIESHPNVVMTRTFSKLYGLGGLRVGWGYADRSIIDVLNRIRGPFNLSSPALVAAEAAAKDTAFAAKCISENTRLRSWLRDTLLEMELEVDPSFANFVTPRFASQAQAEACYDALEADGILVRKVAGYQLPTALRITVGDEAGCRRVAHAIRNFLGSQE